MVQFLAGTIKFSQTAAYGLHAAVLKRKFDAVIRGDFVVMLKKCVEEIPKLAAILAEKGMEFAWDKIQEFCGWDDTTQASLDSRLQTISSQTKPERLGIAVDPNGKLHRVLTFQVAMSAGASNNYTLVYPMALVNVLSWLRSVVSSELSVLPYAGDDDICKTHMCTGADGVEQELSVLMIKGDLADIHSLVRFICKTFECIW